MFGYSPNAIHFHNFIWREGPFEQFLHRGNLIHSTNQPTNHVGSNLEGHPPPGSWPLGQGLAQEYGCRIRSNPAPPYFVLLQMFSLFQVENAFSPTRPSGLV